MRVIAETPSVHSILEEVSHLDAYIQHLTDVNNALTNEFSKLRVEFPNTVLVGEEFSTAYLVEFISQLSKINTDVHTAIATLASARLVLSSKNVISQIQWETIDPQKEALIHKGFGEINKTFKLYSKSLGVINRFISQIVNRNKIILKKDKNAGAILKGIMIRMSNTLEILNKKVEKVTINLDNIINYYKQGDEEVKISKPKNKPKNKKIVKSPAAPSENKNIVPKKDEITPTPSTSQPIPTPENPQKLPEKGESQTSPNPSNKPSKPNDETISDILSDKFGTKLKEGQEYKFQDIKEFTDSNSKKALLDSSVKNSKGANTLIYTVFGRLLFKLKNKNTPIKFIKCDDENMYNTGMEGMDRLLFTAYTLIYICIENEYFGDDSQIKTITKEINTICEKLRNPKKALLSSPFSIGRTRGFIPN